MQIPDTHKAIYQTILNHPLAPAHEKKSLADRIMERTGWNTHYTARVLDELRKFYFLYAYSGKVSPSTPVDIAWHQHILDMKNYEDFCMQAFGHILYHAPDKGAEKEMYMDWYRAMLDTYRELFETEPPRDIWYFAYYQVNILQSQPSLRQRIAIQTQTWIEKIRWWMR